MLLEPNLRSGAVVGVLTVSPIQPANPAGTVVSISRRAFLSPRSLGGNQITDITPLAEALQLNSTVTRIA